MESVPGGNPGDENTEDANKIVSKGLKFVFSKDRDSFPMYPCFYVDDGNPDMYTEDNMKKRQELKNSEIVQNAIRDLMSDFTLDRHKNCSKEEFVRVLMILGTALRPNIEADELNELINHDFSEASQDKFKPTEEQLADKEQLEQAQQQFD